MLASNHKDISSNDKYDHGEEDHKNQMIGVYMSHVDHHGEKHFEHPTDQRVKI